MRLIIILLIAAMPATCLCQSNNRQIIKISGISMEQLISGLLNAGYSIEKSEASMSVIITHLKEVPQLNVATQIKAKIRDGIILLSGEYTEPGKPQAPITDDGTDGSPGRESWNLLYGLARSFKKPLTIE